MMQFPIYIPSKSRFTSLITSRALHAMNIPHTIIVEQQEAEDYRQAVPKTATVLVLDPQYQRDYSTCDDLGDSKSKGPGPARNFAWDHSIAQGATWHWVMDDNIYKFQRVFHNQRIQVVSDVVFACMEDFCLRYDNVAMAGPNYTHFVTDRQKRPPLTTNTRIYSCNLIRNDIPFRWRGRYNEDTDLSLQILKAGWCTVQFNAFLQKKMWTQTLKGGNTKEFYEKEGTLPKSQMLVRLHPDVATLVWKFGRHHHHVDYRRFQINTLKLKPGIVIKDGVDNYGMVLQDKDSNGQKKTSKHDRKQEKAHVARSRKALHVEEGTKRQPRRQAEEDRSFRSLQSPA